MEVATVGIDIGKSSFRVVWTCGLRIGGGPHKLRTTVDGISDSDSSIAAPPTVKLSPLTLHRFSSVSASLSLMKACRVTPIRLAS
jgi:hypothetical protein